jgi:uncharacterized protein (UPF0335 family)
MSGARKLTVFSADERIKEIAEQIIEIQGDKKLLGDAINELLKEAKALGVPQKAMRLAIALMEDDCAKFDRGFITARRAVGIPVQMEFSFEGE